MAFDVAVSFAYDNKVEPYALKVTGLSAVTLTTMINVTAPTEDSTLYTYYDINDENNFMYGDYSKVNGVQVSDYLWFLTYLKDLL